MPWITSAYFASLVEMESLVPLNLLTVENQFHKPQNQFRKLIRKFLFL